MASQYHLPLSVRGCCWICKTACSRFNGALCKKKEKKEKQSAHEHNMPFGTQTLGWSQRADPFASSLISRNHRAKDGNAKICGPHSAGPACLRKSEAIRNDLRKINGKSRLPLSSAFRRLCRCNTHTILTQDGRRAPEELHMFY